MTQDPALVTGEAVALDLRTAALPSRLLAALLDGLIQLALLVGLFALAAAVGATSSDAANAALSVVVLVLVLIGLPTACEALLRGRTPGKAALGLRVVRDDGGPIGFRQAFVRALAAVFLERPGVTFFLGAVVTMLLNPRSKRIGDLLAGTVVLRERVAVRGGTVAVMPSPLAGWAASLDLSGLPDDLALSARQFVARAPGLTAGAREQVGGRLVAAVTAAVQPPPPAGTPGWAVLAAVLAERRRREELRLGVATGGAPWQAPGSAAARAAAPAAPPAAAPARTPTPPPAAAPEVASDLPGGFAAPG